MTESKTERQKPVYRDTSDKYSKQFLIITGTKEEPITDTASQQLTFYFQRTEPKLLINSNSRLMWIIVHYEHFTTCLSAEP